MRLARCVLAGAVVGGFAVVGAMGGGLGSSMTARAELDDDSSCQASGSFRGTGVIVDADTSEIVTVRRSDTVDWQASVASPPGEYTGSIWVDLPPPLGSVEIDSWSGVSQTTSNTGTEEYDLPKLVPAGAEFTVSGEHVDANGTCSGSITLKIDGSPFASPITWIGLGGAAATGLGLVMTVRPMFRRVT